MTSIPESPKQQFLFFFDNKLVAGEPGGNALIADFYGLLGPMLGLDGKASGKADLSFAPESFAVPDLPASTGGAHRGDGGNGHGNGGEGDGGSGLDTALGLLGGLARGDLDI